MFCRDRLYIGQEAGATEHKPTGIDPSQPSSFLSCPNLTHLNAPTKSTCEISDQFTVVEVVELDRPGLLYEVTAAMSDLNLDITSAHITTFGERAVDAFYVTDLTNKKIVSPDRQKGSKERLIPVLGGETVPA